MLVDDLTGEVGEDVETVEFALDGISFEIDLDEPNATKLRDAFADYIENGRRTGRTSRTGSRPRSRPRGRPPAATAASSTGTTSVRTTLAPAVDPQRARKWARNRGYTVPDRGRLPKPVLAAYRQHLASV